MRIFFLLELHSFFVKVISFMFLKFFLFPWFDNRNWFNPRTLFNRFPCSFIYRTFTFFFFHFLLLLPLLIHIFARVLLRFFSCLFFKQAYDWNLFVFVAFLIVGLALMFVLAVYLHSAILLVNLMGFSVIVRFFLYLFLGDG